MWVATCKRSAEGEDGRDGGSCSQGIVSGSCSQGSGKIARFDFVPNCSVGLPLVRHLGLVLSLRDKYFDSNENICPTFYKTITIVIFKTVPVQYTCLLLLD